ncbi:MAG: agmatinase [Nitrososphaerota archaeon]|nr:agmatinase [Candidatus Bathyarchaeota archaeon]MDW8022150.1 agmatinase [Nitrososphaerota archaeon]
MGYREIFVSQPNVFSGFQKPFEEANYIILGVPFDFTSTYRTGARFGPNAIREASLNIETYSFRTGLDVEDLRLHDLGDLHVSTSTEQTMERLERVVKEILEQGKTPVTIGGEHTITLGVLKGLGEKASKTAVVSFDAHLDLRDQFMGLKLSHTTFMRRISEEIKPAKIIEVGTRAVCKEELEYAENAEIKFLTTNYIRREGVEQATAFLEKRLEDMRNVYVSIDMDILDPAYAPAVQNPEPEGLETSVLLDILGCVCDKPILGFDLVEVAPNYDHGNTAIQAAKIIFEMLCSIEKARRY